MSVTELGRSASYANTEGTALSIASSLQIAYLNGSAVVQWTRSPSTSGTSNAYCLNTSGSVNGSICSNAYGSRPAFTLPSTLSVSDDGSVSVNTAPTISGSYATGTNLGTKTAGFNLTYTVADADGDTVTVKEYLDNVLQRTYTATLGATNTFQCVTAANFQTVLNGAHTLKVVANDGKADSAAYTITFTKKVTKATITLASALPADDIIQVMVMTLTSSIPADANLKVLVTNKKQENLIVKRVVPENYEFGRIEIESPSGNPIRVYDLERTLCDILRGSGSDVQIVGEAMKRYAASKDKNIHKLMQYADQLRVKPKVLRYMEVLL